MAGVPYVFGNATTSIPLTNLDANFNTGVTIGNTTVGLGNTVTTLGNVTLTNATVSSSSITDSGLTSGRAVYTGTGGLLSANANLTYDGTTFTAVNDASISGLTVGKGGGAVATCTVVGASALSSNSGNRNTAFGNLAANATTTANDVSAFGKSALASNTTGGSNVAFGTNALTTNTTASNNAAFGAFALESNTGGSNTALGIYALNANTTASNSTAVGYQAGYSNTTGVRTTVFGYQAGYSNVSGAANNFFGAYAGQYITGSNNTSMGDSSQAGQSGLSTGNYNSSLGYAAMNSITTGSNNVAIGYYCLVSDSSGNSNTAVGYQAGQAITTGSENTMVGTNSGETITTGGNNVCLGKKAGSYTNLLTTGSRNICIGDFSNTSGSTATDQIVIGYNISGKGNSTGFINAGNGGVYQGNNSAAWSVSSDRRLKKNIVDNTEGLDIINQIQVRNFEYRLPEEVTDLPQTSAIEKTGIQLGVIAQELQEVCSDCVKEESTGVLSVNSDNVFWHLVNAVKELKAEVDLLKQQLGK